MKIEKRKLKRPQPKALYDRATKAATATSKDPLLELSGSGARLWSDEPADEYVRRLREDRK